MIELTAIFFLLTIQLKLNYWSGNPDRWQIDSLKFIILA